MSTPKTQVRAKRMFSNEAGYLLDENPVFRHASPVLILPHTKEHFAAMLEQGAKAMYLDDVGFRIGEPRWEHLESSIVECFVSRCKAAFKSIGITPPSPRPLKQTGKNSR